MIPIILVTKEKRVIKKFIDQTFGSKKCVVFMMTPDTSEYSIDQIKEIIKEIKINQPYQRVYVLEGFDHSSPEAQNAFLKTLEEAPNNINFVMTVENLHRLLPTVVSRAKIVTIDKPTTSVMDTELKKQLDDLTINKNLEILNHPVFVTASKSESIARMSQMITYFREKMTDDPNSIAIIKELLHIKNLTESNNLSSQLALDHLVFFIKNKYS